MKLERPLARSSASTRSALLVQPSGICAIEPVCSDCCRVADWLVLSLLCGDADLAVAVGTLAEKRPGET
jgi:hypothetical protein